MAAEDGPDAIRIIKGFSGFTAAPSRMWDAEDDSEVVIEASAIYYTRDHEPHSEHVRLITDALALAGINCRVGGNGVSEVYGPDARWVDAVHVDTGERYCKVLGETRDEALEQLVHVAAFVGVPVDKLTVLPPID
jgi:hypothetical protein